MENPFNKAKETQKEDNTQEKKPQGRRVCAWCKKDMGPADTEQDTHGICEDCATKFFKES